MKRLAAVQTVSLVLLLGLVVWTMGMGVGAAQDDRPRREVNVTLEDEGCPQGPDRFCVQPADVSLEDETDLILYVENKGRVAHNLTFAPGTPSALAERGMNASLAVNETKRIRIPWPVVDEALGGTEEDTVIMQCGLSGHAALGEVLRVEVPSLAATEEQPQPGVGIIALGAILAGAAIAKRRFDRE